MSTALSKLSLLKRPIYPSFPASITGFSAAMASNAARLTPTNTLPEDTILLISVLAPVIILHFLPILRLTSSERLLSSSNTLPPPVIIILKLGIALSSFWAIFIISLAA